MGRDWHRFGGSGGCSSGGGLRGGGGGRPSSSSNTNTRNAASGCMAALFRLFDFHHFYLPPHHHQPSSSKPTIDFLPKDPKGLAAPRNSLELKEESSTSTTYKEQESLNIPMGIQVKTKAGTTRSKLEALTSDTSCSSSETVSSPGTKTPNLVARLMGLDLLPDNTDHNHSPAYLHTISHRKPRHSVTSHRLSLNGKTTGTRSLPESPRVSSARRSDFDLHRLSLQLNKENKCEELVCSRLKEMKQEDESWSPQDYARQIVNRIKERVSTRRVGVDITNTVKNREPEPARNHHELRRNTIVSCSPRNRFPEKENKTNTNLKKTSPSISEPEQIPLQLKPPPSSPTMLASIVPEPKAPRVRKNPKREKQQQLRPINKCKKAEHETRLSLKPRQTSNRRIKQEETFVRTSPTTKANHKNPSDKKRKKTSLSNDVINISVTSVFPVKKIPSTPAAKLPQKQVNEAQGLKWNSKQSICSSQTYKHEENLPQVARYPSVDDATTVAATSTTAKSTEFSSEYEYVTRILSYAGITETDSPVPSATWFSPSRPIDLSIFRNIEHFGENPSGPLALRCNRKLLFDLVNEILVDTLKPKMKRRRDYHGLDLISELCSAIRSYPRARFRVLEDIDVFVAGNLPETKNFEEEGDDIVAEIERDIVDALVRETTSDLFL